MINKQLPILKHQPWLSNQTERINSRSVSFKQWLVSYVLFLYFTRVIDKFLIMLTIYTVILTGKILMLIFNDII